MHMCVYLPVCTGLYVGFVFKDCLRVCVQESTVRVIWAYHSEDVGPSGPVYHGLNRGRKSLRLLTPAASHTSTTGSQFFDLKNRQVRHDS